MYVLFFIEIDITLYICIGMPQKQHRSTVEEKSFLHHYITMCRIKVHMSMKRYFI